MGYIVIIKKISSSSYVLKGIKNLVEIFSVPFNYNSNLYINNVFASTTIVLNNTIVDDTHAIHTPNNLNLLGIIIKTNR